MHRMQFSGRQADVGPDLPRVIFSISGRPTGGGIYASPALAAGAPALAPVRKTVSAIRPSSSALSQALARAYRPALPVAGAKAEPFSPFNRHVQLTKTAPVFSRLAVPPLLRRPVER